MPEEILKEHGLVDYKTAIKNVHFPESDEMLDQARKRLAFDELFLLQLQVLQKRWHWQQISSEEKKSMEIKSSELKKCTDSLPFTLTNAQKRVTKEILEDLQKPYPMSRLIQGDVGCGKTIVAALAAIDVIENGFQVAIMAPTEILARQNNKTLLETLKPFS